MSGDGVARRDASLSGLPVLRTLALVAVLLLVAGCGSSGPSAPASLPTSPVGSAPASSTLTDLEDWSGVGAEEERTQRLITLNYRGPDGDGTLKLALRMATGERFSVQGTDRLGRKWFLIAVEGEQALLLNQRDKSYCRFEGEVEILAVPLGPLSFSRLPALLLNRLPSEAVNARETADGLWIFEDSRGRSWNARIESGALIHWALLKDGAPEVYWSQQGDLSFLSARTQDLQLRWKSSRPQSLVVEPAGLSVPAGFVPGECD